MLHARVIRYFGVLVVVASLCAAPGFATISSEAVTAGKPDTNNGSNNIDRQRRDYLAALDAVKVKDFKKYTALMSRLQGYPLRGYVEYEYLKDNIAFTPPETLHKFLHENRYAQVSDQLRKRWLRYLADLRHWDMFLKEYDGLVEEEPELQCYRLEHLLQSQRNKAALTEEVLHLWFNGNRLPAACDALFAAWRKNGNMTTDAVWVRIKLAMERRNPSLASQLGAYLPAKDRVWLERWLAMHRDPLRELRDRQYPLDTSIARQILRHGMVRLANKDPGVAMQEWQRLREQFPFLAEDDDYVFRSAGLVAAQNHMDSALAWLSAVSPKGRDEAVRQWRLRAAVRAGEWEAVNYFFSDLNETEQKEGQWRYWKARVLEKLGQEQKARELYKELATERSYYGFLAADRLDIDYSIAHVGVEAQPEEVEAMLALPGMKLAQELFLLGQMADARRQWAWTTRGMNNHELKVAAVIAAHWGWHDRAIMTLGKTDHLDDLELRFPILYRDIVEASARANNVDSGWIYGVMRQESAFVVDARSDAGALGLMQVMPMTGRFTGRGLNMRIPNNDAILKIENNLRLGSRYLKIVLDQYRGHQVLATASYNAGPNRVKEWLPDTGAMDADVWVESIPYTETRNYVKNVLGFTTVYDYRLGNKPTRLQARMPTVAPAQLISGRSP